MSPLPGCFYLSHFSLPTALHSYIKGPESKALQPSGEDQGLSSPSASSLGVCKEIILAAGFYNSHLCTDTRSEGFQLLSAAAGHWAFAYSMASVYMLAHDPSGSGGKPGAMLEATMASFHSDRVRDSEMSPHRPMFFSICGEHEMS